jgi:fructokinase
MGKLGGQAAIVTKTGIGAMGQFLKSELNRASVITDYLIMDHRVHTSIVFISRTAKTADFEAFRGGDYQLVPEEIRASCLQRAKIVHASTWPLSREPSRSAVEHAFKIAAGAGKVISLDPNYSPQIWPDYRDARATLESMLAYTTIAKPSRDDAMRIFGRDRTPEEYIRRFHDMGPEIVIFTMGSDGIIISQEGSMEHIPSRQIEVVDATGAGDAFWAGFLVAMLDGNPLKRSVLFAREIVERKLSNVGPLPDMIDRDEIYARVDALGERE